MGRVKTHKRRIPGTNRFTTVKGHNRSYGKPKKKPVKRRTPGKKPQNQRRRRQPADSTINTAIGASFGLISVGVFADIASGV